MEWSNNNFPGWLIRTDGDRRNMRRAWLYNRELPMPGGLIRQRIKPDAELLTINTFKTKMVHGTGEPEANGFAVSFAQGPVGEEAFQEGLAL